jgi:hypothetical protein
VCKSWSRLSAVKKEIKKGRGKDNEGVNRKMKLGKRRKKARWKKVVKEDKPKNEPLGQIIFGGQVSFLSPAFIPPALLSAHRPNHCTVFAR